MNCGTIHKATIECKNYRKSISSLEALRPLFSAGLLNFKWFQKEQKITVCRLA